MICSHCDKTLADEALVCPTCGTLARRAYLREEAATMEPQNEEEKDPFALMPPSRTIRIPQRVKIGILAGMAVVAIAIFAIRFLGGEPSQATPEGTVKGFFHAFQDKDAEKMVSFLLISDQVVPVSEGEDKEEWFIENYTRMFEEGQLVIEDFEIVKAVKNKENASVNYKMDAIQQGVKDKAEETIQLKKVNDKWFIIMG